MYRFAAVTASLLEPVRRRSKRTDSHGARSIAVFPYGDMPPDGVRKNEAQAQACGMNRARSQPATHPALPINHAHALSVRDGSKIRKDRPATGRGIAHAAGKRKWSAPEPFVIESLSARPESTHENCRRPERRNEAAARTRPEYGCTAGIGGIGPVPAKLLRCATGDIEPSAGQGNLAACPGIAAASRGPTTADTSDAPRCAETGSPAP